MFNRYGVFVAVPNIRFSPERKIERGLLSYEGHFCWSEKLLNISPRSYKLSIYDGSVHVFSKKTGKERLQIQPEDIRVGDSPCSGWRWVGNSQYLTHAAPYSSMSKTERQTQKNYDRRIDAALAAAGRGEKPEFYDKSTYVRIPDPKYINRRVMILRFRKVFNDNIEGAKNDGVVIDPRTKQFVARRFEYPFSHEKWGVPFVPHYSGGHLECPI